MRTRDLFPGHFGTWKCHIIPFQCSASCIRRASHVSLCTACWILLWILSAILRGGCRLTADVNLLINNCPDRPQNGCETVKNALYSVRLGSIAYLKLWKKSVFISSTSVSGFCFDSLDFIAYLCVNEGKENTFFQLPKKFALQFTVLFVIKQMNISFTADSNNPEIITVVSGFLFYPFQKCIVKENTGRNYFLAVCCILSVFAVSLIVLFVCFL